jgi:alkylation response protein AidB-like acyl-CoA dehydrogenase
MSLSETDTADCQAWLEVNWDPTLSLREWRERLVASGWGRPSWPTEWFGRGLAASADATVEDLISRHGAIGLAFTPGALLAGPTLLAHASDELKGRLLRPMLTGEERWCQLFSEPDAGSDLASLNTRAVRDGDHFIVNGQKIWSSSANHAERGMLLARTGTKGSRHDGITFFALDMTQPGIEVRPIHQMNGHASFNEVFLTDVRVRADDVVGEVDGGWTVARTTLAHERRLNVSKHLAKRGAAGRTIDEAREEAKVAMAPYSWYPQRSGRPDLLMEAARENGRLADPVVRQEIARVYTLARCAEWTAARARAGRAAGKAPGPEGSIGKLQGSNIARAAARTHSMIAGLAGLLTEPIDGRPVVAEILTSVPAISIAGGTDEIQKNILAERILGLPRDNATS